MAGRSKNLLKNHCAKDGLDCWEVVCSGGDGFKCEEEPLGCKKICECTNIKDNLPCWSTSYQPCEKFQLVYLPECGISEAELDAKKRPITVRDWYCPRSDSGCKYKIRIRLLAEDKHTELNSWSFEDAKDEGSDWTKVKHVFKDYPSGVRYLEFKHGGEDTKNWAGHYGVKMTNSGVFVGNKRKRSRKNLLKNPCASSGLDCWEVVSSGGDGFKCEKEPSGCKKICECTNITDNLSCWSTSHQPCVKFQLVYLPVYGISGEELDEIKPPITVRDWYSPRFDCGCKYKISVRLLADDKNTELDSWRFEDTKDAGSNWTKVKHVFNGYPSGVRYLEFKHGGEDTKNWAGHFGVKMTNSGVFVDNKRKRSVPVKYGKNLLKNPCASSDLQGWEIVKNGGNGFKCEEEPAGCKPIKEANEEAEGGSCWSTSHQDCEKRQIIDLVSEGFDSTVMDVAQPVIKICEWFASRSDAGCKYWLRVRLLNSDMEQVESEEVNKTRTAEGKWYKVEKSFSNYGPGVKFIEYSHGGRDTCNWGGNYGAKISCSSVAIFAENQSSTSSEEN